MLASLLPGLREVRAPLAAGYLWLVVGWLFLHDRVDRGTSASGAVDALTELRDAIGLGGIAAAATFVAYVLGALWEPISVKAAEILWRVWSGIWSLRARFGERHVRGYFIPLDLPDPVANFVSYQTWEADRAYGFSSDEPPRSLRISKAGWSRLWLIGQRLAGEVDETLPESLDSRDDPGWFRNAFRSEVEPLLVRQFVAEADLDDEWIDTRDFESMATTKNDAEIPAVEGLLTMRERTEAVESAKSEVAAFEFGSPRDSWWIREARDFADTERPPSLLLRLRSTSEGAESMLALQKMSGKETFVLLGEAEVTARLFDELPLVARRLVGEQQELFLEASRIRGEVEFRYALAIPIPIAASVLAFGLGVPTWAWIASTLAGVLAGWALLTDGWRRDAQRNDLLVELLAIGKASSPTFERLVERARQAHTRTPTTVLREMLSHPDYEWRSIGKLATAAGTPEDRTRELLVSIEARASTGTGPEMWGLISRVGPG